MMTWNYRVFREADGAYVIREVHYNADGSIVACTENAVEPFGETLEELAQDLEYFNEALELPVLTMADIPQPSRKKQKKPRGKNLSREQLMAELSKPKVKSTRQVANTRTLAATSKSR